MAGLVYLVGHHSGDDACGRFNLYGVFAEPGLADAAKLRAEAEDEWDANWVDIIDVPLDTFGWLGYTSTTFEVQA